MSAADSSALTTVVPTAITLFPRLPASLICLAAVSHIDTLVLIKPLFASNEYREVAKQFSSLLSLKNASEYQSDLMSSDEAKRSLTWAGRIIERVRQKLKGP